MIMRGLAQSLKEQNWTAILIEFVLLVVGAFLGIQVANWNEARIEQARTKQALDAFRVDMRDQMRVAGKFGDKAATCLAAFEAARLRGAKPAPRFIRIRGSDTPPESVWEVARQSGLADLVQPGLMFEIGFYYSEIDGVGAKFVRYSEFVNERILPHLDDPTAFYDERGELKPEYRQNMQRLREWVEDNDVLAVSAECLLKRFDAPKAPGQSCRPDYEHLDGKAATP
jgi:hypothetical protein